MEKPKESKDRLSYIQELHEKIQIADEILAKITELKKNSL